MFDRGGRRKYLNGFERRAFLRVAEKEADLQQKAFSLTLFYTGCRISEALKLKPDSVDFSGGALVFETLKQRERGKFRAVPIPDSLLELLRGLPGEKLFWNSSRTTGYRQIKVLMAEAGIVGAMACPKGLRHGFAVACISQGVPLTTVQKWLGHGRLETTAIYLNVSGHEERQLAKRLWAADSTCQNNTSA